MTKQRAPRERDPEYLGWIAQLPCAACMAHGRVKFGVHVAHLRAGSLEHGKPMTGMQTKPDDRFCSPLCPEHHVNGNTAQHHTGDEVAWWNAHGIDPFALCLALSAAYETGQPGTPVIARFGAMAARMRLS